MRERERWENSLQPITTLISPYGKGYSTPPPPPPVTVTVILGHSVFHIFITQHTRCKVYNLLALHLAVYILGFKGLLQPSNPTILLKSIWPLFKDAAQC